MFFLTKRSKIVNRTTKKKSKFRAERTMWSELDILCKWCTRNRRLAIFSLITNKTAFLLKIAIHLPNDNIFPLSAGGMTVIYFQRKDSVIASLILVIEHFPYTILGSSFA